MLSKIDEQYVEELCNTIKKHVQDHPKVKHIYVKFLDAIEPESCTLMCTLQRKGESDELR